MFIPINYEKEFDELWENLKKKYPKELFDLEGIGKQLDLCDFSKTFFKSANVADNSADANSNVDDLTVVAYENELSKPWTRLNSLYLLWKYGKKIFGIEWANMAIEKELAGEYYINDLSNVQKPYCYNFSTFDVMNKGLPFVKKIQSKPAKHLSSFCGQMVHFTSYASNQVMGAVGLADLLIVLSYYVRKELEENPGIEDYIWRQVKQEIQSIIYSCNQPFRGGLQSGFYNVSIYDDEFLDSLIPNYIFPDGRYPDKDLIKKLQDVYLDLMNETMDISPITFPVTTACFCVDSEKNIKDEKFLEYIAKKNLKWAFINIYAGETSTLSSCCFDGKQKCLSKSSNGVNLMTFKDLYDGEYENYKKNFTVYHNGSWCKGNVIRLPKRKLYKITTSNKKEIYVTDNHILPTLRGDKVVTDLSTSDYILFNSRKLDSFPEKDRGLTYEQGFLIGMYLGDGSTEQKTSNHTPTIHLSINEQKYINSKDILEKALLSIDEDAILKMTTSYNNVYPVYVRNWKIYNFIKEYVSGDYCYEKSLNMNCLLQSYEFRRGILDGLYETDGGNSNRIYTTSKQLSEDIETLITSLGMNSIIDIFDRTDEQVIIRGQIAQRNYPLYCIRWYDMKNKRSMKDIYIVSNNSEYFKIVSIEQYDGDDEYVYCFEMENEDEPYFTLPNGCISHNCRLRSKKNNEYLGYTNSFGGASTQIGSFGVVTLNLPHIALLSNGNEEIFFEKLKENVDYSIKLNHIKRYILQKRISIGALPLYSYEFMDIKKQYATTGVNGLYECIKFLGKDILKEDGQALCKKILNTINDINEQADKEYKYAHNLEQTPSENSAIKLAHKDKVQNLQDEFELYSNQFIPLIVTANLLDRIRLQGMFDSEFSGGSIMHCGCDMRVESYENLMKMIRTTVKAGCVYHAINYNLQKCEDGHMSVGKNTNCAICGKPITDNYVRVVGFIVNTKNFHKVRREVDYPNRQLYSKDDIESIGD